MISGNVVSFNCIFIGYGYEFGDVEGDGNGDMVIGIGGISLDGVTNGGVEVLDTVRFNWSGHECVLSDCFNGSNNSKTLPSNNFEGEESTPISIKFGSSVWVWLNVEPFLFDCERNEII